MARALQSDAEARITNAAFLPILDAWASCLEWATTADLSDEQATALADAADLADESYDTLVTGAKRPDESLSAMTAHLDAFEPVFEELGAGGRTAEELERYRSMIYNARERSTLFASVMAWVNQSSAQLTARVAEAKKHADEAAENLRLTQEAASNTATTKLEESFESTAKSAAISAMVFRMLTIVVLGGVVVLGAYYAISHEAEEATTIDWPAIVYRLTVLSGLAAVATYLARQASHYRRIATWAQGIQIQLKAFLGFITKINDDDAKQTMYVMFGKRVLEAPPDGKNTDDSVTNVIQPIFEQATKLRPNVGSASPQ